MSVPLPPLSGQIRADGVSFSYSRLAPTAVSSVSLEIQPGQHIGIVGRSGSGKSTLAHLLLGLYRPTSGRIEFDGHDLASMTGAPRSPGVSVSASRSPAPSSTGP
jgi:ABC-type bacteriocin/lantibiotic exporter with double-glycine peptidase domain